MQTTQIRPFRPVMKSAGIAICRTNLGHRPIGWRYVHIRMEAGQWAGLSGSLPLSCALPFDPLHGIAPDGHTLAQLLPGQAPFPGSERADLDPGSLLQSTETDLC